MASPIGLGLFRFVEEAANEITESEELRSELDPEDGLLLFTRDFYLQFFEKVLDAPITSIGSRSGQHANQLMRSTGKTWKEPVRGLVRRFQRFCKIHAELLGEQYESGDAITDFQRDFVLDLLGEITTWAGSADQHQIEKRAAEAEKALRAAVEEVPVK